METLRVSGFSDEDIWDIGAIAALFAMSNRLAHLTNLRPNEAFFLPGGAESRVVQEPANRPLLPGPSGMQGCLAAARRNRKRTA